MPVTITEYLAQVQTESSAPQDGVVVSVTTTCCEDKGIPLWPFLFAGAIPFFFLPHGHEMQPPVQPPGQPPGSIVPLVLPTPPPTAVPEPTTLALGLIGLLGFALLRKGKKAVKTLLMLLLLTVAVEAKPKTGTLKISLNRPMTVTVNKGSATVVGVGAAEYELPAGEYPVEILLPDGNVYTRTVTVKAHCTVALDLSYTPPAIVEVPVERIVTKEVVKEAPAPECKPEVTPYQFDVCCNCRPDDLKARLDLFAVELNRAPTNRGVVHAGNNFALDYLINTRGIDRSRLTLQVRTGGCVEMWIQP